MPCVIVLLLLGLPRVAMLVTWLFSTYLDRAASALSHPNLVLLLGFFFLPLTTLAWAWARNTYGAVQGLGMAAVVVALLLDLGLIGFSRRRRAA